MNPYPKSRQLAPHERRKKEKQSNKEKGTQFETEVAAALNGKRNYQGGAGGGLGRADVSAMRDWHLETKNTERLSIPEWLRTLKEECPTNKRPALVFVAEGEVWLTIRLGDRVNFAADLIETAGYDVVPR